MIRIIYSGIERADFVYYLSCILSTRSSSVAVNDTSVTHDLFDSVSKHSDGYQYDWTNVKFVKDASESESSLEGIDIYIEYRGIGAAENIYEAKEDIESYHLIMPDYTASGYTLVEYTMPEGMPIYIFRDLCSGKVNDKSFSLACNLSKNDVAGHIELSGEDIAAYVAFTHNGRQKFSRCSADMQNALSYVAGTVLGIEKDKEINKIMKTALRKIK